MDFDGDGLIQFAVTEELLERAEGLEDAVSNTGTIKAEGRGGVVEGPCGAGRVHAGSEQQRRDWRGPGGEQRRGGSAGGRRRRGVRCLIRATLNAASEKGAGGTIKLKAEGKVAVSGEARITAASRTGNGGRIDISGADVAVSGSALITAASGTGQARTGNALLNMDSSFRRAAPGVLPSRRIQGILPINDSEGADSKGLAANKKPRHSSESWNPGKTTHSGPGRNHSSESWNPGQITIRRKPE